MFIPNFPEDLSVENEAYCSYLLDYFASNLKFDNAALDDFGEVTVSYNASVIAKQSGILAGLEEVTYLLSKLGSIKVESGFNDGDLFKKGDVLLTFYIDLVGFSFKYERIILNLLSRLCGIATLTNDYVKVLASFDNKVGLLSTRKVLLGPLDKKAFVVGGGFSHRINQSQALMIKKYHKNLYGLGELFDMLGKKDLSAYKFLEIEVHSIDEAEKVMYKLAASDFGIPVGVMFDNFSASDLRLILADFYKKDMLNVDFIEASGSINLKNLNEYDIPYLNYVSVGAITKSSQAVDLSFDLERR